MSPPDGVTICMINKFNYYRGIPCGPSGWQAATFDGLMFVNRRWDRRAKLLVSGSLSIYVIKDQT